MPQQLGHELNVLHSWDLDKKRWVPKFICVHCERIGNGVGNIDDPGEWGEPCEKRNE